MNTLRHGDEDGFASTVVIRRQFPAGIRRRMLPVTLMREASCHVETRAVGTHRHVRDARCLGMGECVTRRGGCRGHELLARAVAETLRAGHGHHPALAVLSKHEVWPEKRKEFVAFSCLKALDNPC
jgi:hypothetical protein